MSTGRGDAGLQKLRDFTVQIRHGSNKEEIVGTGIVVTADGMIATCKHVALEAGVKLSPDDRKPRFFDWVFRNPIARRLLRRPLERERTELWVYFREPILKERAWRARVVGLFREHDDDVVLLRIVGAPIAFRPDQVAVLGSADYSGSHDFISYGYVPKGEYPAGRALGKILGDVEPPVGKRLQADPIELDCQQIDHGISGGAVLDTHANLVVGIIYQTHYGPPTGKNRDAGWAVNARVLGLSPLNLPLRTKPLPKKSGRTVGAEIAGGEFAVSTSLGIAWNSAPPPLLNWVGRDELLRAIGTDWVDSGRKVTALIGLGGQGKSSLARRWVDELLRDTLHGQPDGVFWWGFYENPSVDEFFESALSYLSKGLKNLPAMASTNARMNFIAGLLGGTERRLLLVLDGLEVVQYRDADNFGTFINADLRDFLNYFAAGRHHSFCLITSRVPLFDLIEHLSYTQRIVDQLSTAEGSDLFRKLGVSGTDVAIENVVASWGGHALRLNLLGKHLVERYKGEIDQAAAISGPTMSEVHSGGIDALMQSYDASLSEAELAFLMIFSAFRTPVPEAAFRTVFRTHSGKEHLNAPIVNLDDRAFETLLKRVISLSLLGYDSRGREYVMHPLIRTHYFGRLRSNSPSLVGDLHRTIAGYYLRSYRDSERSEGAASLDALRPLFESIHHGCRSGAYDRAWEVYFVLVEQQQVYRLGRQLGAFETGLAVLLEFFPDGDASKTPLVSDDHVKGIILNSVGFRLAALGRLAEAPPFHERAIQITLAKGELKNASADYMNLAELYAHLGSLSESAEAADQALRLAKLAEDPRTAEWALTNIGWAAHLRGKLEIAGDAFRNSELILKQLEPGKSYNYSLAGFWHAEHLRRTGHVEHARAITKANLAIAADNGWSSIMSRCLRLQGDFESLLGAEEKVRELYGEALRIARSISHRPCLIEVLLARGRWAALQGEVEAAQSDLHEALDYALDGGYRVYEADIRIGLAWAFLAMSEPSRAREEAEYSRKSSTELGYHWGQVDSAEVLAKTG